MKAALAAGRMFNPGITEEGAHCYIMVLARGNEVRKQYLGKSLQHYRFALGCGCEAGHCYYETLHNFTSRQDMLCKYCSTATGLWEAANKKLVSEAERSLMVTMQKLGIDRQVACEVDLPWWHGRLDFYHMPTGTAIQVDGSGHFKGTYHMLHRHQLQLDLKCCRAAWLAQGRLLRLHHDYGMSPAAVLAAIDMPCARFVMVTRQYEQVAVKWSGITKTYTDWLSSVLVGAQCYFHCATHCFVFY